MYNINTIKTEDLNCQQIEQRINDISPKLINCTRNFFSKGSSINDVMVLGEGSQGYFDDSNCTLKNHQDQQHVYSANI